MHVHELQLPDPCARVVGETESEQASSVSRDGGGRLSEATFSPTLSSLSLNGSELDVDIDQDILSSSPKSLKTFWLDTPPVVVDWQEKVANQEKAPLPIDDGQKTTSNDIVGEKDYIAVGPTPSITGVPEASPSSSPMAACTRQSSIEPALSSLKRSDSDKRRREWLSSQPASYLAERHFTPPGTSIHTLLTKGQSPELKENSDETTGIDKHVGQDKSLPRTFSMGSSIVVNSQDLSVSLSSVAYTSPLVKKEVEETSYLVLTEKDDNMHHLTTNTTSSQTAEIQTKEEALAGEKKDLQLSGSSAPAKLLPASRETTRKRNAAPLWLTLLTTLVALLFCASYIPVVKQAAHEILPSTQTPQSVPQPVLQPTTKASPIEDVAVESSDSSDPLVLEDARLESATTLAVLPSHLQDITLWTIITASLLGSVTIWRLLRYVFSLFAPIFGRRKSTSNSQRKGRVRKNGSPVKEITFASTPSNIPAKTVDKAVAASTKPAACPEAQRSRTRTKSPIVLVGTSTSGQTNPRKSRAKSQTLAPGSATPSAVDTTPKRVTRASTETPPNSHPYNLRLRSKTTTQSPLGSRQSTPGSSRDSAIVVESDKENEPIPVTSAPPTGVTVQTRKSTTPSTSPVDKRERTRSISASLANVDAFHYTYLYDCNGVIRKDILKRLLPSVDFTSCSANTGKLYLKGDRSIELVFRQAISRQEEEAAWALNNPFYSEPLKQQKRGRDVKVFIADVHDTASQNYVIQGLHHCMTSLDESNTLIVLLMSKTESSTVAEVKQCRKNVLSVLKNSGVDFERLGTRIRTFIVNATTGEKVDSSFRSIARELREDAANFAALETDGMDIDTT